MDRYGICEECGQPNTFFYWCHDCSARHFRQNFKNWTSGNSDIDKFIRDIQLSANDGFKVLEWIPYDRFYNIKYIARGGFGKVYKSVWIDGYIHKWNNNNRNWERRGQNKPVALKSLNNSKNVTLEFINEIALHYKLDTNVNIVRLYGITQDPETRNYMMVLDYAANGSLRNYLDKCYDRLSWKMKIYDLHNIAYGIKTIHEKGFIHRDLHIGNTLKFSGYSRIADMGLCKPANHDTLENPEKYVYGVLPYIAPEILRGQDYTKASDIYSFGMIMYEVISGLPPYHDISHDKSLAIKICQGFRPRFDIKVPKLIINLIKRCLDANPKSRLMSNEIERILEKWLLESDDQTELKEQIIEADEINSNLQIRVISSASLGLSYATHSKAIYTSRLLNFDGIPEPKNSDDYYEKDDNIISKEFSESLPMYILETDRGGR